jgi:hypothetical protein
MSMTEMPALAVRDVTADELTVGELGAFAGGTSSTAHPTLRDDRAEAGRATRTPLATTQPLPTG